MEDSSLSGNAREIVFISPESAKTVTMSRSWPYLRPYMKISVVVTVLLSASVLLAQDNPTDAKNPTSKHSKDEVTIRGCVSRSNSDYILMKQDPGVAYELQATGKTRLKNYLGQEVEITARKEPTLSSSSDALNKIGSAAPETLAITSIKTVAKNCSYQGVSRSH